MSQSRLIGIASVFLAAALSAPAWGADPAQTANAKAIPARPGSLNYIEGQASIEGHGLGPEAIGKTELKPGQSIETQTGKLELLLTPGVFFRLGNNSSVTMISPGLSDTELRLNKGEATAEVAELHAENKVVIVEDGAKIRLTKTGFYDFDADHNIVRVYQGHADVQLNGRDIEVKNEHQLSLGVDGSMKPEKFDKATQDDLYRWSSLRSSYLAEANLDRAQDYQTATNWYGAGWDWDPYYDAYTFIPGDGIFYSPFGWGFYSPFDLGFAPFFFFGHFNHRFEDRNFHHFGDSGRFGAGNHYYAHVDHGVYRGPGSSGHSGFAGHPGAVAAGFHGGNSGGGFHGGGGSIGSHGIGAGGGGGHGGGGGGHR